MVETPELLVPGVANCIPLAIKEYWATQPKAVQRTAEQGGDVGQMRREITLKMKAKKTAAQASPGWDMLVQCAGEKEPRAFTGVRLGHGSCS